MFSSKQRLPIPPLRYPFRAFIIMQARLCESVLYLQNDYLGLCMVKIYSLTFNCEILILLRVTSVWNGNVNGGPFASQVLAAIDNVRAFTSRFASYDCLLSKPTWFGLTLR
jgi:hypothetical protein